MKRKSLLKLYEEWGILSMKIKLFIIVLYTIAGLVISAITAFMTFVIIGTPIGIKMFLQIIVSIVFVLPIIITISYFFGKYLSNKFNFIEDRLQEIKDENFTQQNSKNFLKEIDDINQSMNFLSNRLDTLIDDLKQKNQNLSDLLISMAHDVKTPITIIQGHIEEIEDNLVTKEDLPQILTIMKQELDFLNELTVDMLDFIASMKNHKIKQDIELHNFLHHEIFPIIAKKDHLAYINETPENIVLKFNKMDLKKIFLNILNNATKYTNHGYIKVYAQKDLIIFENTGEPIKEEFFEKIFEPFFTISESKNRKDTGFGLGLSIVKNLAKNNGYNCFVHVSNHEKTVFYLEKQKN